MSENSTTTKTPENPKERYSSENIKKFLDNSIWALKTLFKLSPRDFILQILISVLIAIIPIGTSFYSSRFIDEIIKIAQQNITGLQDLDLTHPIFIALGLSALLNLSHNIARLAKNLVNQRFRIIHFKKNEIALYRKISRLDVQQFEDKEISNSIRKAKDNIYKLRVFFQNFTRFSTQLISTVISAVISFTISPFISAIIVLLSLPNNYFYARFINQVWEFYNSFIEEQRKKWWLISYLTSERNLPEQKVNKSENLLYKKTSRLVRNLWVKEIKPFKDKFVTSTASSIINALTYVIVPINLLNKYLTGQISIGDFTFYQGRFLTFGGELDFLLGQFLDIFDSAIYIGYIRDILELEPAIESGHKKLQNQNPPQIEFKNVFFKYPKSDNYVLENISFTIKPGEEVALVGPNGAGKTTIVKLLLRFYDPTRGEILIDGKPLEDIDLESYYNSIGAIFQEFNFYGALNVADNIGISKPQQQLDLSGVKTAAKKASADEFIESLDNKYEQILSKSFTGGTNLSTGQKQKIALSRIFYRNSSVLILDEPTASIDAQAEYQIFEKIYKITENKSVIVISHRFSTVKHADKIFVLKEGKLVESGTHEELIEIDGQYAKSFNLQAESYTEN